MTTSTLGSRRADDAAQFDSPIPRRCADRAPLTPARLVKAKAAYTTGRVPLAPDTRLLCGEGTVPEPGDVVLARVSAIGQHKRLELSNGRRAHLFPGDEILVAYGHRYAPDQFLAEVPCELGPCDLAAAGGVASRVVASHAAIGEPTRLEPIGLLCGADGRRVNLRDWALPRLALPVPAVPTVAIVGTSMNAGKTTTAAGVVRGLRAAGLRPGAAKVTGTGAGGDVWLLRDAGADPVLDFTAAGLASTYLAPLPVVEETFDLLRGHLAAAGADVIVVEVADGVFQRETAELVAGARFRDAIDGVIFAAGDALGAIAGVSWLRERGVPVLAVSGVLSASPLAMREAERALDVPVLDLEALGAAEIAAALTVETVAAKA